VRRPHIGLVLIGLAALALTACRPDTPGKPVVWEVDWSSIPVDGVDTAGTAHVGLDILLEPAANPYNPCHPQSDADGQYNDSFYAACIDANANPMSYFKHWMFGPGGHEIAGGNINWGNWEPNHCPTASWCPRQGNLIVTDWAKKVTGWALEFYPHRSDEGGLRIQGGFTQSGPGWVAAPNLGVVRLPRVGAGGTVQLHGYVYGSPATDRYQIDVFQRSNIWWRTSSGYPAQGFASLTNTGGSYRTGPLPMGGYYVVVTDNWTGESYGGDKQIGADDRMDIIPTAPCFGLHPAYTPFTGQLLC
jgi:hypothetical protein